MQGIQEKVEQMNNESTALLFLELYSIMVFLNLFGMFLLQHRKKDGTSRDIILVSLPVLVFTYIFVWFLVSNMSDKNVPATTALLFHSFSGEGLRRIVSGIGMMIFLIELSSILFLLATITATKSIIKGILLFVAIVAEIVSFLWVAPYVIAFLQGMLGGATVDLPPLGDNFLSRYLPAIMLASFAVMALFLWDTGAGEQIEADKKPPRDKKSDTNDLYQKEYLLYLLADALHDEEGRRRLGEQEINEITSLARLVAADVDLPGQREDLMRRLSVDVPRKLWGRPGDIPIGKEGVWGE